MLHSGHHSIELLYPLSAEGQSGQPVVQHGIASRMVLLGFPLRNIKHRFVHR